MSTRIFLVCLLSLAWACSTTDGETDATTDDDAARWGFDNLTPDIEVPGEDSGAPVDTLSDLSPGEDTVAPLDVPADLPLEDAPPVEDLPPVEDVAEDVGPAQDLAPCLEDEDCASQLCGWHFGMLICLPPMEQVCPANFAGQPIQLDPESPEVVVMCVSRFSHLCLPCWSHEDCQDELTTNHVCGKMGNIGGFCATVSDVPEADPVCPEGYIVSNTLKMVGEDPAGPPAGIISGCVPPMGICPCSPTAAELGLDTFCFSGSDELGWCMGERVCTEDGLAACSVSPPSEEVCDGEDNDCDGETDEGLCEDEDECTQDSCNAEAGCVFEPLTGTPCSDNDLCTADDLCQAGLCVGTPIVYEDMGPCAEITCDPLTGDQVIYLPGPCDDGDICTTDDQCIQGACVGDFDPPGPPPEEPCMGWTCDGVGGWYVAPQTGDPCEDGDPCSLEDTCDEGTCMPGGTDPCDDENTCTTDSCEADVGCAHAPIADCCGNGVLDDGEECDDGNQEDGDGCDPDCVEVEISDCADGANLISAAPSGTMMLCDDPTNVTCEQDFAVLCPAGWHLCSTEEFNARNDGWTHPYAATKGLGSIHCRNGGGAGHFSLYYDSNITSFGQDSTHNCGYGSSLESCPSSYGCNEQQHWALCCAPGPLCGNSVVDSPEETCDDGNDNENDDCLKNCTTRMCPGGPGS